MSRSSSPPLVMPRALIFLASIWLIGSWVLAIGLLPPVHPTSTSYEHGLQMMLLCLATGSMVGWPLLRLSQAATHAPIRQTILDLFVMISMVQVIIWPLRLVTSWSLLRTAAIDATMTGWLLLAGSVVASAIRTDRAGPRTLAMLSCVGMCLLGPALTWVGLMSGVLSTTLVNLSPIIAVRKLGDGRGAPVTTEEWRWILFLHAAAAITWMALLVWTAIEARTGRAAPVPPGDSRPAVADRP